MIERGDIIGVVLGELRRIREKKGIYLKSHYADCLHHYRHYLLHSILGDETQNAENDQVSARGS